MRYPEDVKTRVYELYLDGKNRKEIIAIIDRELGVIVKAATIISWAEEGGWNESRALAKAVVYNDVTTRQTKTLADLMQNQIVHMDKINRIVDKASSELEELPFSSGEGAAKAAIDGSIAFNKLAKGMIEAKFVEGIINILIEELPDEPDTLQRIQIKFQRLLQDL